MTEVMKVPFFKLGLPYQNLKGELDNAYHQVFEDEAFGEGPHVRNFEEAFAQAHDMQFCAAVASGTSALHLILTALNIGQGHEVIVPTNTCFATAAAVSHCGAKPVFVDSDAYYGLSIEQLETAVTSQTKAIIAVHLYGQAVALDRLQAFCTEHQLHLVEDCAQALFAQYQQRLVGTFGVAAAFSFYPTKNLGAYGEAGAVITNDDKLYRKIQRLKNLGSSHRGEHQEVGFNYRMDGLQAALLKVKLPHVQQWNEHRRKLANLYLDRLKHLPEITLPSVRPQAEHVYHLFVIEVAERNLLQDYLRSAGITTLIHYPIACHLQPAYQVLEYEEGSLPRAEQAATQVVSLPLSEQHELQEISYVAEKIIEYYQ